MYLMQGCFCRVWSWSSGLLDLSCEGPGAEKGEAEEVPLDGPEEESHRCLRIHHKVRNRCPGSCRLSILLSAWAIPPKTGREVGSEEVEVEVVEGGVVKDHLALMLLETFTVPSTPCLSLSMM